MGREQALWALGMMSGTSMDGIDAAMVLTDGREVFEFGACEYRPYLQSEREVISRAQGLWPSDDRAVTAAATEVVDAGHAELASRFSGYEVIGFHGQTVAHDPAGARTHQIGGGAALQRVTGQKVVSDFRSNDMRVGGQGAPLAPFFHHACAKYIRADAPVVFLNLGGVANISWVDPKHESPDQPNAVMAFDTGPANALMDDFAQRRLGKSFDDNGDIAALGTVEQGVVDAFSDDPFFEQKPPKSLDRNHFSWISDTVDSLSTADGLATLAAATVFGLTHAQQHLPTRADRWLLCGGGRKNHHVVARLNARLDGQVIAVEDVGLSGDMLEAQAFAYLAVRSLYGLSLSAPGATGVAQPVSGGIVHD